MKNTGNENMNNENTDTVFLNTEATPEMNQSCARKLRQYFLQNIVMVLTLLGICLGFALGFAVREFHPSEDALLWIGLPRTLYIRLLKMTIVPLVTCSVIAGASSLAPKINGKIGTYVVLLVVLTHILGCTLSTGLALLIRPGSQSHETSPRQLGRAMKTHDVFADLLRNLMPDNIVGSTFRQTVTKYVKDEDTVASLTSLEVHPNNTATNVSLNTTDVRKAVEDYTRVIAHTDGINVLGLITICALFGIAAGKVRNQVLPFISFIENTLQLVLIVVRWFLWFTPVGVISLIAHSVAKLDNVFGTFSDLGLFVLTVTLAVLIHWTIVLPLLYAFFVRKNPLQYFLAHFPAVSIAFAAANSVIAMPKMLDICEKKYQMDTRLSRIVVPFTITINADGSGIFIVSSCMFLTDYSGVVLTADKTMIILVLSIVSSLAIPAVPSSSVFTVIVILTAVQVPAQYVALLFAVEWFLDRIRTGLNVVSHMTITACAHSICKKYLHPVTGEENNDIVA